MALVMAGACLADDNDLLAIHGAGKADDLDRAAAAIRAPSPRQAERPDARAGALPLPDARAPGRPAIGPAAAAVTTRPSVDGAVAASRMNADISGNRLNLR